MSLKNLQLKFISTSVLALSFGLLNSENENIYLPIILIFSIFFMILLLVKPTTVFYMLILFIPLGGYWIDLGFIHLSVVNGLIILLSGIIFLRHKSYKIDLGNSLIKISLILFMIILIATLISELYANSIRFVITRLGSFLTFLLVLTVVNNFDRVKKTLIVIYLSALATSLLIIITFLNLLPSLNDYIRIVVNKPIGPLNAITFRSSGTFGTFASYGIWIESIFPLLFISFWKKQGLIKKRPIALFALFTIILAAFLTQSRSTWIALIVSFFICILLVMMKKRRSRIIILSFSFICIILLYHYIFEFSSIIFSIRSETIQRRIFQYQYALQLFTANPILGLGREGFSKIFYKNIFTDNTLHNNFLSILVAHGLAGFLPYISLIIICFYLLYKLVLGARDEEQRVFSCGLFAAFVGILIEIQFAEYLSGKGLWLMMGLIFSLYLISHKRMSNFVAFDNR